MSVPKTKTINQFIANIGDIKFYFDFLIYDVNDILVYRRPDNAKGFDQDFLLIFDKDYKVTFGPTTFNNCIELLKPCANKDIITISCNLAIKRDIDYNFNSQISSVELNAQHDKIIRFIQQIADKIDYRSLNYQISNDLKNGNITLPALKENELWLGTDSNIAVITTYEIGELGVKAAKAYLEATKEVADKVLSTCSKTQEYCESAYNWANHDFNECVVDDSHKGYSAYHWMKSAQLIIENGGCAMQEKFFPAESVARNRFITNWTKLKANSFSLYIDGKRYPAACAKIDSDNTTIILDFATNKDVLIVRNEAQGGGGMANADMSNVHNVVTEYIDILAGIGVAKNDLSNVKNIVKTFFNLIFVTGEIKAIVATIAPDGWLMLNDGTIGSGKSKATTRANDDTKNLFILLWQNINSCAVIDINGINSRGKSAQEDWQENKTISLPSVLGRVFAASGNGYNLTVRSLGQTLGTEKALSASTKGKITLRQVKIDAPSSGNGPSALALNAEDKWYPEENVNFETEAEIDSNMQPTVFLNWIIKL